MLAHSQPIFIPLQMTKLQLTKTRSSGFYSANQIYTSQIVIVKRMNNTLAPLAACVPSADLSVTRVYLLSVSTRAGCSVSKSYNQVGACNQRKEVCNSNYVSSLVDTRSARHARSRNVSRQSECHQARIHKWYFYALLGNTPNPQNLIFFSANQI